MNGFYRALSVAANRHMPRPKSHEDPEPEPSAEQIETMKDVSDSYSRVAEQIETMKDESDSYSKVESSKEGRKGGERNRARESLLLRQVSLSVHIDRLGRLSNHHQRHLWR